MSSHDHPPRRWPAVFTIVALAVASLASAAPEESRAEAPGPNLLLITLDTTRDDVVGPRDGQPSLTPELDRLAASGVRYTRALSPAPLTLPAHASLLTGLDPPEHGLRDNGSTVLPLALPTLATVLSAHGYDTGAVVATRVLDRRFGLARGFATYDDRMLAEKVGEYGYPERDAEAVTDAALAWLAQRREEQPREEQPYFLWVHYYDPHFPYAAPGSTSRGAAAKYGDEVAYVDRQVGRLLAGLPETPAGTLTAIVGDHGEALGDHGEPTHGVFVYSAVLEVPLILAGPGVASGKEVAETVAIRRLGPTLLRLVSPAFADGLPGTPLPGLALTEPEPEPVYSETWMPRTAYGWSPLRAITDQLHRLIVAPRPELYDLVADPAESRNLVRGEPAVARRLRDRLLELEAGFTKRRAAPAPRDGQLAAELRSLGYLSGGDGEASGLDPKDGVLLLGRQAQANHLLAAGQTERALAILQDLNAQSPNNVPFLVRLASVQQRAGRPDDAIETFLRALKLQPKHEFLVHHLGQAYAQASRPKEAETAYRAALGIDQRFAPAWISLAQLAHETRGVENERTLLHEAVKVGVDSLAVYLRLIQIETEAGSEVVGELYVKACELAPEVPSLWLERGGWHLDRGEHPAARDALRKAAELAPGTPVEAEARKLLERIPG